MKYFLRSMILALTCVSSQAMMESTPPLEEDQSVKQMIIQSVHTNIDTSSPSMDVSASMWTYVQKVCCEAVILDFSLFRLISALNSITNGNGLEMRGRDAALKAKLKELVNEGQDADSVLREASHHLNQIYADIIKKMSYQGLAPTTEDLLTGKREGIQVIQEAISSRF